MLRRKFISTTAIATAATAISLQAKAQSKSPDSGAFQAMTASGFGGVAVGNCAKPTSEADAQGAMESAWDNGVRTYDTAPFYGHGLSERRFSTFLYGKPRDEYMLSTKVGRLLEPDPNAKGGLWKNVPPFSPKIDYSASATRRSIEDSLQRLGIERIDIVYIHDLSPDNFGNEWTDQFEIARKGAMVELAKMKSEGLIKGWGLGVNTLPPLLKTLEVAEPDILLTACQYSIVFHEEALEKLLPAATEKKVSLMVGAPLNFGFLAGRDRYNYGTKIPDGMLEKRAAISEIAKKHGTDLRTAALQFSNAPSIVTSVIPGARDAKQAMENTESFKARIPADFWAELKKGGLIAEAAEIPA